GAAVARIPVSVVALFTDLQHAVAAGAVALRAVERGPPLEAGIRHIVRRVALAWARVAVAWARDIATRVTTALAQRSRHSAARHDQSQGQGGKSHFLHLMPSPGDPPRRPHSASLAGSHGA